ncbi:anthrone oxygenase family protein [Aquincola sp. MAHUQ-54]|uniref:Anthrone oxygenase family protein n=1 Tax=Aquincola agrisoli TaxID=3119538 RepID=A0AAW9Q8Z2_9BURK
MLTTLPLLVALGAGLVGGVFFAFSTFVMKALSQLPAAQGVAAMQRINAVVLNPLFLGLFVGTAVFAGLCVFAGFVPWGTRRSALLLVAGLCYLLGSFGVTAAFNVPRNERLARLDSASPEAAAYWPVYLREWRRWNHVRTIASVVSAACAGAALTP